MNRDVHTVYRFGEFELDPNESSLRRDGREIPLQPQVFNCLLVLVRHAGQLVTKQDLMDALWPNTFVNEEALGQVVFKLRRSLGDHHEQSVFIRTVRKRGFRFLPTVAEETVIVRKSMSQQDSQLSNTINQEEAFSDIADNKCKNFDTFSSFPSSFVKLDETLTHDQSGPYSLSLNRSRTWLLKIILAITTLSAVTGGTLLVRRAFTPVTEMTAANRLTNQRQHTRRLTFFPEREQDCSVSPDGKSVVFVSTHGGGGLFKIFLLHIDGSGEPVRLTRSGAEEFTPRFSPDGRWIAYGRGGGGEPGPAIWKVAATPGGEESLLAFDAKLPTWSPDSREIAFLRISAEGEQSLVRMSLENKNERQIFKWTNGIDVPAWSPDGQRIAFVSQDAIWVVSADGGTPRRLSADNVEAYSPEWTPDGKAVICSANFGGQTNLWLLPLNGNQPALITSGSGLDVYPSISRDWKRLVYTNEKWQRLVWTVERDGHRPQKLETKTTYLSLSVHPKGELLAFSDLNPSTPDMEMGILNSKTLEQRKLGQGRYPTFSPDGNYLAFLDAHKGSEGVWIIELSTGNKRRLTATLGKDKPAWSPDGQRIVFQNAGSITEKTGLVILEVSSGQETLLASGRFRFPAWSPDGHWIAAGGRGAQDYGLYLFDVASNQGRKISERYSYESTPIWNADSRTLQILVDEQTKPALLTFDLNGKEVAFHLNLEFASDPSVWGIFDVQPLPDGRWIYTQHRVVGDIYLLDYSAKNGTN
jgi:Tol biopolymer transport system component/DNA-binding winged helix-turn-helix (wHTH) protein